jgi:hypothetical protein
MSCGLSNRDPEEIGDSVVISIWPDRDCNKGNPCSHRVKLTLDDGRSVYRTLMAPSILALAMHINQTNFDHKKHLQEAVNNHTDSMARVRINTPVVMSM